MRTVGIVAEYNPFHTGHAYHIRKAKELSGADYVVVVMSPDFVQRGEPAVFDKFTRARMALMNGADLVIGLPVCYASGSAEYFAEGAVTLLTGLNVIDTLCFGAETADADLFCRTAEVLLHEPPSYSQHLRSLQKQGRTWPQARCEALSAYLAAEFQYKNADIAAFLSHPNNILGIEYCRAIRKLGSPVLPLPVPRKGSAYDSTALEGTYCSASALRNSILNQETTERLFPYVPRNIQELFSGSCRTPVSSEDLLPFLIQKFIPDQSYSSILDISPDLSDRIRSMRHACIGRKYSEIVSLLKTKQITEARIRRALLHLILDIRTEDVEAFRKEKTCCAKVLGFRRTAGPLLHQIKNASVFPLITRPSRAKELLNGRAKQMWEQDLCASHLYRSITSYRAHTCFRTEYEISPLVL